MAPILPGVCLAGSDLSEALLWKADVTKADLSGASLRGARFSDARLSDVRLDGADLEAASLSSAYLSRANLQRARPINAALFDTDLNGADLSHADLTGARLTDAEVIGADLHGADLSGACRAFADLTSAKLAGAKVDLISAEIAVLSLNRSILAARRLVGWIDEESIWKRANACCRGGWAVILAGEQGRTLAQSHGLLAAAAFIHVSSCPALGGQVPNFHAYDLESYEDLQQLAEAEPELPAGFEADLRDRYQRLCEANAK
jgi:Pentapeptide repeats (8 copies)